MSYSSWSHNSSNNFYGGWPMQQQQQYQQQQHFQQQQQFVRPQRVDAHYRATSPRSPPPQQQQQQQRQSWFAPSSMQGNQALPTQVAPGIKANERAALSSPPQQQQQQQQRQAIFSPRPTQANGALPSQVTPGMKTISLARTAAPSSSQQQQQVQAHNISSSPPVPIQQQQRHQQIIKISPRPSSSALRHQGLQSSFPSSSQQRQQVSSPAPAAEEEEDDDDDEEEEEEEPRSVEEHNLLIKRRRRRAEKNMKKNRKFEYNNRFMTPETRQEAYFRMNREIAVCFCAMNEGMEFTKTIIRSTEHEIYEGPCYTRRYKIAMKTTDAPSKPRRKPKSVKVYGSRRSTSSSSLPLSSFRPQVSSSWFHPQQQQQFQGFPNCHPWSSYGPSARHMPTVAR